MDTKIDFYYNKIEESLSKLDSYLSSDDIDELIDDMETYADDEDIDALRKLSDLGLMVAYAEYCTRLINTVRQKREDDEDWESIDEEDDGFEPADDDEDDNDFEPADDDEDGEFEDIEDEEEDDISSLWDSLGVESETEESEQSLFDSEGWETADEDQLSGDGWESEDTDNWSSETEDNGISTEDLFNGIDAYEEQPDTGWLDDDINLGDEILSLNNNDTYEDSGMSKNGYTGDKQYENNWSSPDSEESNGSAKPSNGERGSDFAEGGYSRGSGSDTDSEKWGYSQTTNINDENGWKSWEREKLGESGGSEFPTSRMPVYDREAERQRRIEERRNKFKKGLSEGGNLYERNETSNLREDFLTFSQQCELERKKAEEAEEAEQKQESSQEEHESRETVYERTFKNKDTEKMLNLIIGGGAKAEKASTKLFSMLKGKFDRASENIRDLSSTEK